VGSRLPLAGSAGVIEAEGIQAVNVDGDVWLVLPDPRHRLRYYFNGEPKGNLFYISFLEGVGEV